jgi:hypothetical protein
MSFLGSREKLGPFGSEAGERGLHVQLWKVALPWALSSGQDYG